MVSVAMDGSRLQTVVTVGSHLSHMNLNSCFLKFADVSKPVKDSLISQSILYLPNAIAVAGVGLLLRLSVCLFFRTISKKPM